MRKAFAGLATLLVLLVVLQFYLAASGAFDSAPKEEAFRAHEGLGYGILLLALLLTLFAAFARMPARLIGMTGLVVALGILQPVIAGVANALDDTANSTTAAELVFGLHAVNGLALLALVVMIVRHARQPAGSASAPARAGTGDDVEVSDSAS